ncbi:MAG: hypothetical protein KJ060_21290 [Candidatus Hydrogenedentes bacterium]|nr:hypothetical protein [Candidatus Hydrogenedentota bacterium]
MSVDAKESPTILVVYPQPGRTDALRSGMPRYEWLEAPNDWPNQSADLNRAPDAIVIDSEEESDDRILQTCEALRRMAPIQKIPVLVAISMYRMNLGNRVKKYPRTNILIFPIEDADLQRQLNAVAGRP